MQSENKTLIPIRKAIQVFFHTYKNRCISSKTKQSWGKAGRWQSQNQSKLRQREEEIMKLQKCCAGCSEPFQAKLVQGAPGKGRHSSRTASLITSLPSGDWEPYLAECRKPFWPISRKLLSATWITPATNVGWVKLPGVQALPTLQLWLIFLSYAHQVLKAGLLFLCSRSKQALYHQLALWKSKKKQNQKTHQLKC